jgi:hypothetical protein
MRNRYVYLCGGAIGDALLGVHLGRTLAASGKKLTLISSRENKFVREIVQPLPFIHFVEMPKSKIRSWVRLLFLLSAPHDLVFCPPLQGPVPLWWKLIERTATLWRGSKPVRCVGSASPVPSFVKKIQYNTRQGNMFDLVPAICKEWDVPSRLLQPHIDAELYGAPLSVKNPYLLFNFIAPVVRRTVPVEHARNILTKISAAFPNCSLYMLCTKESRPLVERMTKGFAVVLVENASASEVIRTIAGASAYVGVETGITHLACHIGVPVVVLGHRLNPSWLPYYAPNASVLFELARCLCEIDPYTCFELTPEGEVMRCLFDIPTERVVEALKSCIENAPQVSAGR